MFYDMWHRNKQFYYNYIHCISIFLFKNYFKWYISLVHSMSNVCDAGPTLNQHWIKVQCLRESPLAAQQTQDICITFIQRRPNVFDVGPALHEVIQMFCVYWVSIQALGLKQFPNPAVIQSACLQASDQVGARAKCFELLTHRCLSSIYALAVIWELVLNEALGMKRIFSIIME